MMHGQKNVKFCLSCCDTERTEGKLWAIFSWHSENSKLWIISY